MLLSPVNADAQAAQIAAEYLADAEEVAAAKAAFQAAFDDAAAGGLAAKQAPAPVHTIAAPAPLAAAPALAAGIPYGISALNALGGYPYAGLPVADFPMLDFLLVSLMLDFLLVSLMPVCLLVFHMLDFQWLLLPRLNKKHLSLSFKQIYPEYFVTQ